MAASKFDPQLVLRAKKGDERSRNVLLERLSVVLERFFKRKIGDQALVDDLIQCTLLRVHSGLIALKHPDKFKAFAMKAALFELHDYYRGRHSMKERSFEPELLPEKNYSINQSSGDSMDVEKALELLKPRTRRILELREHGYKYREIADILNISETAVKMQVKRAFEKMKTIFAD
ncbi:MAG: RNA polymerase sigma factor [Bacteroidetes bacterium]|nr:RNA polymerase sigma factor [Bacteroidota bacterium]